jgi:Integrase core domain
VVSAALADALAARDPDPGVIFHSEGLPVTSREVAARFASLKGELIDLEAWATRARARRAIVEFIAWYNGTRLHSTLCSKTPAELDEQDKIKKAIRRQRGGHQQGGMTWPGSAMTSRPLVSGGYRRVGGGP